MKIGDEKMRENSTEEELKLYGAFEELMHMVLDNAGLGMMVEYISDLYDAPVSIIDSVYNVVAFSQKRIPADPEIAGELISGHLGIRPSQKVKGLMDIPQSSPSGLVTKMEIPYSGTPLINYITQIKVHNSSLASFSVFTRETGLTPVQELFLEKISAVLALEMYKSSFYSVNKSRYFTHLLSSVLEPDTPDALADIEKRFELFGYRMKEFKRIILLDIQDPFYKGIELVLIADKLHTIIPNNVFLVQDSSAVFLSSQSVEQSVPTDLVEALCREIGGIKAFIGISEEFQNIEQTPLYFTQAKNTIDDAAVLLPGKTVAVFDDIRYCDMILQAAKQNDIRFYHYPPCDRLVSYDEEHGTNLVETLLCYLETPRQQLQVCERLHIHRNTLYYRLDKIREICGADIDNGYVIAQIFNSLAVSACHDSTRRKLRPF